MKQNRQCYTIKNNCFYCFVFNDNDEIITWCRVAKPWDRKTIYVIRQVETKDQFKGKGYASLCYFAVEEYISKIDNARKIISFVDDENVSSIKLHEKLGYTKNYNASKYLRELYGWNSAIMFEKKIVKQLSIQTENTNIL